MKHCVITGAADGIGRALALRFGRAGYQITGIDRDPERSAATTAQLETAGTLVTFLLANLGQPDDIIRVVTELRAGPLIDVLIHNAGINSVSHFASSDLAQQQAVLDVNLLAPLLLMPALLHGQHIRTGGSVVFLSSLSHFVGYPGAPVYAASKDGLAAYARSLAVGRPDLHVLTVFPGPTRTAHARRYSPDNRREHRRMPPERLAEYIFQAVQKRQRTLIPGLPYRFSATMGRFFPGLAMWMMRKTILEKLP